MAFVKAIWVDNNQWRNDLRLTFVLENGSRFSHTNPSWWFQLYTGSCKKPGDLQCYLQMLIVAFVSQLQLARAFCHSLHTTLSELDCILLHNGKLWYFCCQCVTICFLLWMVSWFRSKERASLEQICCMALTSSSAWWAKWFPA